MKSANIARARGELFHANVCETRVSAHSFVIHTYTKKSNSQSQLERCCANVIKSRGNNYYCLLLWYHHINDCLLFKINTLYRFTNVVVVLFYLLIVLLQKLHCRCLQLNDLMVGGLLMP